MAILRQAQQLTRAVKNVGRMREITAAMSRFGFGTLVDRMGLRRFRPENVGTEGQETVATQPFPVRLRLLFEQLGPTFIKLGQILAGRPDLVPAEVVRELEKLQDRVPPLPFLALKPMLEQELGRTLDQCFSSFDPEPLAVASIAQVHAARTLDGEEVVVKIQKPDVEKALAQDFEILDLLGQLLERYVSEIRAFRPRHLVAEFRKSLLAETNFTLEAANVKRYAANFAANDFLVVPKVYQDLSTSRVLTLQRLRGVKLSDAEGVRAMGVDPRTILSKGMDAFFQSILVDGFFHGDPHAGNIIVMSDGRLGMIDFGSVGRLSQKAKDSLVSMFLALITQDYELLVTEYLNMSADGETPRSSSAIAAIQRDVSDVFAPYHGLPLKDIPMGKLLMEASGMAFRHKVSMPRDLVLVFKAIMTLEGIGRSLDPDFDLVSGASKYVRIVLRERYAPKRLLKDLIVVGREFARFAGRAPRQLGESLRQLENGELKLNLHVTNLDALARAQAQGQSRVALSILSGGLLVASVMATTGVGGHGTPVTGEAATGFWAAALGNGGVPLWLQIGLWVCAVTCGTLTFWKSWR